jgi:DNA-binding IclR family transcriptional regulator
MSKDVQVIARIGSILDAIGESEAASLKELSLATDLAVSTTSRLLSSLQQEGFVERDHLTKQYRIGRRFLRLAAGSRPRRDIASILHPLVEQLSVLTSEDSGLAELQGNLATFIDRVEGVHALRIIDVIGRPEPLYVGAFRKVLLAFQPMPWIKNYIRTVTFEKFTPNTISNTKDLLAEIDRIKKQGYATSFGEKLADAAGIAAPVYDHAGQIRAAIQVAGPITRINKRTAKRYIESVLSVADQATQVLSGRPASNGKTPAT